MEQEIYFPTSTSDLLFGKLQCPEVGDFGPKRRKLVILSHGYGSHLDARTTQIGVVGALYKRGIDTFRFSFWGSSHSAGNFEKNTLTQYISDLEAAVRYAREVLGYHHISLYGFSCGGTISLHVAAKDPTIEKVAVVAPVLDYPAQRRRRLGDLVMKHWEESGKLEFPNYGEEKHVHYYFIEDAYQHILLDEEATVNRLLEISQPVLLLHGTADSEVPFSQSLRAHESLPSSEVRLFEDDDHWLRANRQEVDGYIAEWLSQ